jgi:hypothetical protein
MAQDCCKCTSGWEVNKTYLKGFLERQTNIMYKPYRITDGPSDAPATRYGYDPQWVLESYDYSSLKNIPWQIKLLDKISIDLKTYRSNCACKSAENPRLIGTNIYQDWKLDPNFSAPSLYVNGNAKWMAIPNIYHAALGWQPYELAKVKIQWQFHKRLWTREEIEDYDSQHYCGSRCPDGPPPCQGLDCFWDGHSEFKFKKWKPPGFFEAN